MTQYSIVYTHSYGTVEQGIEQATRMASEYGVPFFVSLATRGIRMIGTRDALAIAGDLYAAMVSPGGEVERYAPYAIPYPFTGTWGSK